MKKLSLLIVLALSTLFALAQNGRIDLRSTSLAEITHSDFNSLRATFSYGSIESIEVPTERGTFSEIAIEGTYASGEIGTPELPASHQLLAVPFGATPHVNVINYTTTDYRLSDYGIRTLIPHQSSIRKDQNLDEIEFVYNASAYQTRSLATAPEATIEVQGTMRGIRIGSLVINPVSYNPVSNTLRVFNNIEVEVSFDGADIAETERMLLDTYSPYFDIVYKQMFNYRQILDVYTDYPDLMAYPVHMVVITPEDYISALQPWLNWKIQKGFDVNVVTTAQAGSNYDAIQSYVQNLYNIGVSQGATPTFLVLVGDVAQVPNTTGTSTQKVTDLYYGSVDNDYFPDMFYSRMSAENTNQLTAIINKILQYEQYTIPDPTYLNNVTLIAGWDSYWTQRVGAPAINYATTYYYNTAHGFTTVNAHLNQSQYSGCYNALSTGVGFVNYTAHGNNQEWSQPNFTNSGVNQLTNADKYFLAMGNCCLSGNFGYSQPCFGETMIRGENKAAYSYIGSCPNTYWYEDYYFGVGATNVFSQTPSLTNTAIGVYDGIWMEDTYNTVSSMTFLGNLAVCYARAGSYQTSVNPAYYWQAYHVLGDGSIMPYRVQPAPNNVSHANTFPSCATTFQVSAQEGSYVAISQNNVLKGVALVPASGSVNVPITACITSGQVRIVVTKPQRQPYIQDINVSGGAQIYTVSVSANPAIGGTVTGGDTYCQGQSCTVTASANTGYTFTNWTENENVVSTDASYSFTVMGSRSLVANFGVQSNHWTVSENYQNSMFMIGVVQIDGVEQTSPLLELGAFCNGECRGTELPFEEEGHWVYFMAIGGNSGDDITFRLYDHALEQELNLYCFNVLPFEKNGFIGMDEPYDVLFARQFTVSVIVNPEDAGTVTGAGTYINGSVITLTASANNSTFINWTIGDEQVSTEAVYTFTVTEDVSLVANFLPRYEVTALAIPAEGGSVSGAGIYDDGTSCTLIATANDGYVFGHWSINGEIVSTEPSYTFTVTAPVNITANFGILCSVSAIVSPENAGMVLGVGEYLMGSEATLIATSNEGYAFNSWTLDGEIVSTEPSYTFTVTAPVNFTANFDVLNSVIVTINLENAGTVLGEGEYLNGTSVTLTATANEGYAFNSWTLDGEIVSTEPSYTFTVDGPVHLTANFDFVQVQQLTLGWNWFSTYLEITLDDLKAALVEALPGATNIVIQSKTQATTYNGSRWRGQLNTLDVACMYKITVPVGCEITLTGMPIDPAEHPISIPAGQIVWIGFPLRESMTPTDAFAGFAVNGDMVSSKTQSSAYYGTKWRGQLNSLVPGQGYIYKSNAQGDRTFTFPISTK